MDSEDDYTYDAQDGPCWRAAAARRVAAIDSTVVAVPPDNEAALVAAIAASPVIVSIDGSSPAFQHYKSGVFGPGGGGGGAGNSSSLCSSTDLDHAVLAVGYTADAYVVKNSWGTTWGEQGYVRMQRDAGPTKAGICGIATDAMYPTSPKGEPMPVPPKTAGDKPLLPCNCSRSCTSMCGQIGLSCCGGGPSGTGCSCSQPASCPQCALHPGGKAYQPCSGSTPSCPVCINGWKFCSPACSSSVSSSNDDDYELDDHDHDHDDSSSSSSSRLNNYLFVYSNTCPTPRAALGADLSLVGAECMFANNGAAKPNQCGLACTVTAPSNVCIYGKAPTGCLRDGCPRNAVCYRTGGTIDGRTCTAETCGVCLYPAEQNG